MTAGLQLTSSEVATVEVRLHLLVSRESAWSRNE